MNTRFWVEEKSPKQVYQESILGSIPGSSFWDIFHSYEPEYDDSEPANTSKEWLQKQAVVIDEIIKKYFDGKPFSLNELGELIDTIDEYSSPDEEQELEYLSSKYKAVAQQVAQEYILPLHLNENTRYDFICALEDRLEELCLGPTAEAYKEAMRQEIRLRGIIGEYTEEDVEKAIRNLEEMWVSEGEEESGEYEEEDRMAVEVDDFIYPSLCLALSTTFYGFNGDGGNLSYELREELAQEKFKEYEAELSVLLVQKPDTSLLPQRFPLSGDEAWNKFIDLIESNPFMNEFDGAFTIWRKEDKVMFLSMTKEDKELPYEIRIGGLSVEKYKQIVNLYNHIGKV